MTRPGYQDPVGDDPEWEPVSHISTPAVLLPFFGANVGGTLGSSCTGMSLDLTRSPGK